MSGTFLIIVSLSTTFAAGVVCGLAAWSMPLLRVLWRFDQSAHDINDLEIDSLNTKK